MFEFQQKCLVKTTYATQSPKGNLYFIFGLKNRIGVSGYTWLGTTWKVYTEHEERENEWYDIDMREEGQGTSSVREKVESRLDTW